MEDNDMVLSCHTSGHDLSRTQKRQLELTIARLKEVVICSLHILRVPVN